MLRIFLGNTNVNDFLWYLLNLLIVKMGILLLELVIVSVISSVAYKSVCLLRELYYEFFRMGKFYYLIRRKGHIYMKVYICLVIVIWLLFTNIFN